MTDDYHLLLGIGLLADRSPERQAMGRAILSHVRPGLVPDPLPAKAPYTPDGPWDRQARKLRAKQARRQRKFDLIERLTGHRPRGF